MTARMDMDGLIARQRPHRYMPVEERFWMRVTKTEGCWNWVGANVNGRGQIYVTGRSELAPRISWQMHFGPIPDGLLVCHDCDNPACVRPDHLFLGTYQDNAIDAAVKGRNTGQLHPELVPRGEKHGMAKLNETAVVAIRLRAGMGESQRRLAGIYGVAHSAIGSIVRREAWKHVR